ncbi:hypothetical protein [Neolewinella sp.]|uniref:hypothetical protein n=1 Tax=Neolewinella sp. TaxID=2993543 RepID=UPI003B519DAC
MKISLSALLCCLSFLVLNRCSTATDSVDFLLGEGQLELRLVSRTDLPTAPDRQIVLTVADIRLDGLSLPAFRRKTITWGAGPQDTNILYSGELASGDYQVIELVLDPGTDDRGSGPGCYVLTERGEKLPLDLAAHGVLKIPARALSVARNEYVRGLLHFDLARALREQPAQAGSYQLPANSWNKCWASYEPQDPQHTAVHQEVQDVGARIDE